MFLFVCAVFRHYKEIRKQRQSVRMCLKEIDSLSYNMEASDILKEQGLIIRPKVTSSSERAGRLKQKYKRIGKQVALYKPLPVSQPGRHRLNPKFRNRVGRKAAKLRKVCNSIIQLILYVCMLYLATDETSENSGRT